MAGHRHHYVITDDGYMTCKICGKKTPLFEATVLMSRLNPEIMYSIIEGRLSGLSAGEIARRYSMNKNTACKYVAALREFDPVDLADYYLRRRLTNG